jgi:hypothetical protein
MVWLLCQFHPKDVDLGTSHNNMNLVQPPNIVLTLYTFLDNMILCLTKHATNHIYGLI